MIAFFGGSCPKPITLRIAGSARTISRKAAEPYIRAFVASRPVLTDSLSSGSAAVIASVIPSRISPSDLAMS